MNYKKIMNTSSNLNGIGRQESSLVDNFVITRKVNQPELVFNQAPYKDKFFEDGACENWVLQTGSSQSMTGCSICQKHKFTVIFYEQDDHEMSNTDLIEIKNPVTI